MVGHHNISQTSTYLAASLGGDEAAIMAAFEHKMGRRPLPQIDISSGSNGDQPASSDIGQFEMLDKTRTDMIQPRSIDD